MQIHPSETRLLGEMDDIDKQDIVIDIHRLQCNMRSRYSETVITHGSGFENPPTKTSSVHKFEHRFTMNPLEVLMGVVFLVICCLHVLYAGS